jgi:hypothetical protein
MQAPNAEVSRGVATAATEAGERGRDSDSQPLGAQLKVYFDNLTKGPVPDRLLRLTEQLEAAFERGDLRCGCARRR